MRVMKIKASCGEKQKVTSQRRKYEKHEATLIEFA